MKLKTRTHRIIQIGWPEFGQAAYPASATSAELEQRVDKLRARMDERKLTHLVVYGDREHFANIAYLTGFAHPLRAEHSLAGGRQRV